MPTNVYWLRPNGTLEVGYPRVNNAIVFSSPQRTVTVPFNTGALPRCEGGKLMEARPDRYQGGKLLSARSGFTGALLVVDASMLYFPRNTSARFEIENAWPGVEVLPRAWVQVGDRRSESQVQGVWIPNGGSVNIADHQARYIEASCSNGDLALKKADSLKLSQFLVQRARFLVASQPPMDKRERHRMLTWTKITLGKLAHASLWPRDLEALLLYV